MTNKKILKKSKKKKKPKNKHILQWYWGNDWLGNKTKNYYYGKKLDWMKEVK